MVILEVNQDKVIVVCYSLTNNTLLALLHNKLLRLSLL